MSIYVPDDLKTRMDRLTDQINWSGVAQAAFERELRLHPEQSEDKMSALIERLRASKQRLTIVDIEWGVRAGREWAERNAQYEDLMRIENLRDLEDDDECTFDSLPRTLDPDESNSAHEFWEEILGRDVMRWSSPFQVGFLRGAKAVWSEVKDKI